MSTTFISELSPPAIVPAHVDSRTWSCDVTSRDRVKSRDYGLSGLNRSPAAGKRRKRVRFADTVGLPLVQVRVTVLYIFCHISSSPLGAFFCLFIEDLVRKYIALLENWM